VSAFEATKSVRGRCLDSGPALDAWLAANPSVPPEEARLRSRILAAPFPSIDGTPPVYRERPFYDARYIERT